MPQYKDKNSYSIEIGYNLWDDDEHKFHETRVHKEKCFSKTDQLRAIKAFQIEHKAIIWYVHKWIVRATLVEWFEQI